jgi:hypothetical protein
MRVESLFSLVTAGVFYRLPRYAAGNMLRNTLVNELFGRLVTERMAPLECFFITAGFLPI